MSLFVLAETPAGYGLFKAADKKLLKNESLAEELGRPERVIEMLKLKKFVKFESAAMALEEAASLREGKVPTLLTSLLEDIKAERKASLAVADLKLGTAISNLPQFNISPVSGSNTMDLFRSIREHVSSLIPGLDQMNIDRMSLGLSHSMARHKIKFSADKVDSMIIQAIKMLDDLDKDLNVYAMRTKEWYGWHFPEMAKILNDNMAFCRVVIATGMRTNMAQTDLSEILPEEVETALKAAAEISMGTEITQEDIDNLILLAKEVLAYHEYRNRLSSFLESRMRSIAPNLTAIVGFMVGARLIAHAGSLIALAKSPASTIQILGAEKALFRALKTKHDTPKYGIMYHSPLVGPATGKNKGKMARMSSAKAALALRVDALGLNDEDDGEDDDKRAILGLTCRLKLENTLRKLEGKPLLPKGTNVSPSGEIIAAGQFTVKDTRRYNVDADGVTNEANGDSSKSKDKKPLIEVVEEYSNDDENMEDAQDDDEEDDSDDEGAKTPAKSAAKKLSSEEYERLADLAGLSVKKFKRKYERGDVQVSADGTPKVYSKKELKKLRKTEEAPTPVKVAEPVSEKKKKRKYEDDEEAESEAKKDKKQKKKKRQSLNA